MKQSESVVLHQDTVERSFEERQRLAVENAQLRKVLKELLELDDKRPADPTWWRKWWDEARAEAEAILGGASTKKKDTHS